jgi:hypothetical protein
MDAAVRATCHAPRPKVPAVRKLPAVLRSREVTSALGRPAPKRVQWAPASVET